MIEFFFFLVILFVPGYLIADKYFSGLEKWVLSVFLSLSVTSFFYYFVVSFFGISKELICVYSLVLLVIFFVLKKLDIKIILNSIKKFKLNSTPIQRKNLFGLLTLFILVLVLSLTAFFIPINMLVIYDDVTYHLPIINDIADDGKKTFFSETHNLYQVRSNQFPLLFESFVGVTKFFLNSDLFRFVSFFSLILSLFLIYFISRLLGFNEFFSATIYALTPIVLVFVRFFTVESFLSMFFLGCVFFVLKYVRSQNLFFVVVAGFLAGLMFLVKFTGGVFFVGLLLFLLYKRKFKASVLFGLIFVLISLVFVVSHLTVPVEQNSVGGYGEISANILTQVFSNSIKMGDVFLQFFSINSSVAYIFFVPLLCFLGLFWITKKEKNFLKLLIISAVLFLFVNSVISARPTFTGITRYFIPIYSLLCIFAGIQLKKISLLNNKLISIFSGVLFISLILFISIFSLTIFNEELNSKKSFSYSKGIEDDSELVIWFVDGGALSSGFSKSTLYDYSWETDFSGNPCQFLKNNSIDYVVYFHFPIEDLYTNYLGDFGPKLRQSLLDDNCSVKVSKTNDIFKINYENEN